MIVSRKDIADVFSTSEQSIRNWLLEGLPRLKDGHNSEYDTRKCIDWFVERAIRKKVGKDANGVYTLETERARLAHHQANNEALKEAQLKGDLIANADVLKQWSDAIIAMRNKMLALPSKLSKVAINAETVKEIERDAERLIYEALNELNIYESTADTKQSTDTSETTTETDSKPMGRPVSKTKRGGVKRTRAVVN